MATPPLIWSRSILFSLVGPRETSPINAGGSAWYRAAPSPVADHPMPPFLADLTSINPVYWAPVLIVIFILIRSIRIADQYERAVVFRLGRYNRTAGPGLYLLLPVIDRQVKLDLRTVTRAVEQQEGITRDNVPIKVNAVIWFRITDPQRAVLTVRDVDNAVTQVSLTTLRTFFGQSTLDDLLKSQDSVAGSMQRAIDAITEPWGVEVEQRADEERRDPRPPCNGRWRRRPKPCARKRAPLRSRRKPNSKPPNCLRAAAEDDHGQNPAGLELRRMQMITEVGAEQNTMTIIMMPSEFVEAARGIASLAGKQAT